VCVRELHNTGHPGSASTTGRVSVCAHARVCTRLAGRMRVSACCQGNLRSGQAATKKVRRATNRSNQTRCRGRVRAQCRGPVGWVQYAEKVTALKHIIFQGMSDVDGRRGSAKVVCFGAIRKRECSEVQSAKSSHDVERWIK
jgi:hypothetical protein